MRWESTFREHSFGKCPGKYLENTKSGNPVLLHLAWVQVSRSMPPHSPVQQPLTKHRVHFSGIPACVK